MNYIDNLISQRRNEIYNEAFVGKSQILLEIEEEIHKVRSDTKDYYTNMNIHPSILKINRLFEEQFGMEVFSLKIINQKTINGYTQTVAVNFDVALNMDLPSMVEGSVNGGYRWKKDNGLCIVVCLYAGLFLHPELTDSEMVAIILHEIGHNFADALYDQINFANKEMMQAYYKQLSSYATVLGFLLALPNYLIAKKQLKEYNNSYRKEQESKPPKKESKIRGILNTWKNKYIDYRAYKDEISRRKTGGKKLIDYKRMAGNLAKSKARQSLSRQNEVLADKFAGVYGYGPELASGLGKMDNFKSDAQKYMESKGGRLAKASREYDDAVRDICDYDCHPNHVQRLNEEIKLLEREVEKEDIDPRYKLVIYNQIDQLKDLLNKLTKTSKMLSKDENAQKMYNDYVNKNCPGAVEDDIEDKIEEALDKLIEEDRKANKSK